MSSIIRKIGMERVRFVAPIGLFEEERILKNTFLVDVWVEMRAEQTRDHENLDNTVDYSVLHQICAEEFAKESKLIETVAHNILNRIITRFSFANTVSLRIDKLNPPLAGEIRNSFVELNYRI